MGSDCRPGDRNWAGLCGYDAADGVGCAAGDGDDARR